MTDQALIVRATKAMKAAYAPYSRFCVGAALLCSDGSVYEGCNIENASYSATICAERNAIFTAVKDGIRDFAAIAVVGGLNGVISGFTPPCGVCRQVMREFCGDDFRIIMADAEGNLLVKTLGEIMPLDFSAKDMK